MKVINLINPDASECKYEIMIFPDGESHVKFNEDLDRKEDYRVVCRITNASELFNLMQVANVLNNLGVLWELRILYLMGMRMDRIISYREPFTLKIVTDILNNLGAYTIAVFHPHSDRPMFDIKNFNMCDCSSDKLKAVEDSIYNPGKPNTAVCYPDAGAKKRYNFDYKFYYNDSEFKPDVITLKKVRDTDTGAIKSIDFDMTDFNPFTTGANHIVYDTITVVDDLCDAGGTFVGAAKLLRKTFPEAKINIFVRHMVNATGIGNLAANYDHVYFTNSFREWNELHMPENITIIDVASDMAEKTPYDIL